MYMVVSHGWTSGLALLEGGGGRTWWKRAVSLELLKQLSSSTLRAQSLASR